MEDKTEAAGQNGASAEAVKKQIYHIKGPRWRSRLHSGSKTIGIPDLYLHRANVAEDDISESAVKNGFSIPQMVGNETFSVHDMIFDRLKTKGLLSQIGSLFHEVTLRREEICNHRNAAAPLQSRPPQRVTLNEVKLAAYIKELADPNVPLKKLARSVPHGYRGERMLDMLWNGGNLTQAMAAIKAQSSSAAGASNTSRSVIIERAIWFVRVVGSSEITSSRARQGNGITYTAEWTSVVMLWLRRQIVELNVIQSSVATPTTPSSPAATNTRTPGQIFSKTGLPSTSHQDGHYSLLLDDDFRSRWVAKWHYSMMLLRGLCHEHLVDPQAVIKAALDMLRTANLAQLTFALALVQEYLEVVYSSALLVDQVMDTCCTKLVDLRSTLEEGRFGEAICKELESIIISTATRSPDALVNPSRWRRHGDVLTRLLQSALPKESLASITHRNEKLLCALLDQQHLELPGVEQQNDVGILDRIGVDLTVENAFMELFGTARQSSSEKLRSVLIWSTTTWRCGNHRPFAGAQLLYLLSQAKDSRPKRNRKPVVPLQKIDLGTFLLKWISEVEVAIQSDHIEGSTSNTMAAIRSVDVASLIVLVGEAIRLGVFSYPKYLQRLTARGLTAAQSRDDKESSATAEFLHAKVMRSVPLTSASVSLEHQRRIAIYGNRTKESWEEAMERRASKEVANAFAWSALTNSMDWNTDESLRHFWASSRFVQNKVIQSHIMTYFRQPSSSKNITSRCLIQLSETLAKADEYASLCEVLISLFDRRQQLDPSLISICLDIAIEHRVVWISMGIPLLPQLGIPAFPSYKVQGRLAQIYNLETETREQLQESARSYIHGNYTQATSLLQEMISHREASIGLLAGSALLAAAEVLQESKEGSNDDVALVSWLKLVPAAFGAVWDTLWQDAMVNSLHSIETTSREIEKALSNIAIRLIQYDLIHANEVLRQYIVPRLEQRSTSTSNSSIDTAVDLIRALLLNRIDGVDLELLARLRSIKSTLINPDTIKDILSTIASLAILEDQGNFIDASSLRPALCREPLVQIHFQARLSDLCSYLEERLREDTLSHTVANLLPMQRSLLLENALEIDYQSVMEDTSIWLGQQRLFELSVLVHRLDSVESGQQYRGQGKIETIARLSVERWCKAKTMQQDLLALVTQSRSASCAKAVNEELLKQIQKSLTHESKEDVMEMVGCAVRLIGTSKMSKLPSITVSSSLLSSIAEWLATTKDSWEEEAEDGRIREEGLGQRLAVICLLLRFDNIWTAPTKATALQLIFALLNQAVILSCQSQTNDSVVHQMIDVTAYCLQKMPAEDRQAIQNMADTVISMVHHAMPRDTISDRILFLFNRLPSDAIKSSSMVLASSGNSAFVSGRFAPVQEKPWDLHNNVEALDYYLHHDQHIKEQTDVDTTFTQLLNNGPISLELFSAKKTRDRLPIPDIQVDSEVSYGLGWGGEPMFARDLRRGLLKLEEDEVVYRREKQEPEEVIKEEPVVEKKTASKKRSEPPTRQTAAAAASAPKKKAKKR